MPDELSELVRAADAMGLRGPQREQGLHRPGVPALLLTRRTIPPLAGTPVRSRSRRAAGTSLLGAAFVQPEADWGSARCVSSAVPRAPLGPASGRCRTVVWRSRVRR